MFRFGPRTTREPCPQLRSFVGREDGAVVVLWALFLAVALGFLALSFDLGRVASTQSELQSFADQVALAAAGELDGRSDAITRATAAAAGLITDSQTYALGGRTLSGAGDYDLFFLRSLPTDDRVVANAGTTDARLARYVRVQVEQRSVSTPFAAANAAINGNATTNNQSVVAATATAGMTSYACDITPLMFCVPSDAWRARDNIGNQILLRSGGGGAAWGPGNFGFLDVTSLPVDSIGPCAGIVSQAQLYRCLVGAERGITACIRTDGGVDTQPGQRVGLAEAFNARFDIYLGSMQGLRTNPSFRPAPNTVQGTRPVASGGGAGNGNGNNTSAICRGNNPAVSNAMPLPRDPGLSVTNRFGSGNWNRASYVTQNHGGNYPHGTSSSSSRYQMYLAEIAAALAGTSPNNVPLPSRDETGAPMCHTSVSPDPDRRTVIAAAVDCNTMPPSGNTRIVPLEYVKLFMTEPVSSSGSDTDIVVEVVSTAGGVGSGAITGTYNDFIQLYR